jgi:hypothetical protein
MLEECNFEGRLEDPWFIYTVCILELFSSIQLGKDQS